MFPFYLNFLKKPVFVKYFLVKMLNNIARRIATFKWQWAGHITLTTDSRWGQKGPWSGRSPFGRPPTRWGVELVKNTGTRWMQCAWCRTGLIGARGGTLSSFWLIMMMITKKNKYVSSVSNYFQTQTFLYSGSHGSV